MKFLLFNIVCDQEFSLTRLIVIMLIMLCSCHCIRKYGPITAIIVITVIERFMLVVQFIFNSIQFIEAQWLTKNW